MSAPLPVFRRAVLDRRVPLAWWTFGIVCYCGMIVAVWPVIDGNDEFAQVYEDLPEAFQAMFGGDGFSDFGTPVGFLSTYLFSMILPFILVGLGVSIGTGLLAGEEEDGVLELLLAHPIRRRRLVVEKASALVLAVAVVGVVIVVVLALGREPVSLDVGLGGLAAATLGSVLFGLLHGLIALAVGAWSGSPGVATGAAWGIGLAGYLVNVLANLDDSLDGWSAVSPIAWATEGAPLDGNLPVGYLTLAVVSVVVLGAAVALFERHDLS